MNIKSYVILLSVFLYSSSFAQDTLTVGEVFDFEIGDVFQIEENACLYVSCYNMCRKTNVKKSIIDKYYNSTNDTLYYRVEKEVFHQCRTPTSLGYSAITYVDETIKYYNLDSPAYKLLEQSIDTTPFINGTFYYSYDFQYPFNGRTSNTSNFNIGLGSGTEARYAEGLGEVLYSFCSEGLGACDYTRLVYYKKGNEVYGNESIRVGINDLDPTLTYTHPNPVKDYLFLDKDFNFFEVQIFNVDGKLIKTISQKNISDNINMSDFDSGVYLLTFIDDKKQLIHTERILK